MDLGLRIAIGAGVAAGTAGLIIVPNKRQKDEAAMDLFDRKFDQLHPQVRCRCGHALSLCDEPLPCRCEAVQKFTMLSYENSKLNWTRHHRLYRLPAGSAGCRVQGWTPSLDGFFRARLVPHNAQAARSKQSNCQPVP